MTVSYVDASGKRFSVTQVADIYFTVDQIENLPRALLLVSAPGSINNECVVCCHLMVVLGRSACRIEIYFICSKIANR